MFSKIVIIAFVVAIAWALVSSFYYLIRDKGQGTRTVRRLTWRIGLSLVLFILLYVMFLMGWIEPSTPGPIALKP